MRLRVDRESDMFYLRLDKSEIIESEETQPGIILDFNVERNIIGIEILNLSQRINPEKLKVLQFEVL